MSGSEEVKRNLDIPEKLYYGIGEVAQIVNVAAHVLRYWEKEFPQVKPIKRNSGRRFYRRQDVDELLEIRHLLYEKHFTIIGAREYMQQNKLAEDPHAWLKNIKHELIEIKKILESIK